MRLTIAAQSETYNMTSMDTAHHKRENVYENTPPKGIHEIVNFNFEIKKDGTYLLRFENFLPNDVIDKEIGDQKIKYTKDLLVGDTTIKRI